VERSSQGTPSALLLKFRVLRLGLFQDGNVGVGILPEDEGIVVGGAFALLVSPAIKYARPNKIQSAQQHHPATYRPTDKS
jgi:hypothetical protein